MLQLGEGFVYEATTGTVTFQPSAPLGYSTSYTLTVTTGAQDVAGNPMAAPFTLTFRRLSGRRDPAKSISVSPPNGAANVGIFGRCVTIVFSELMDTGTINGSTITVRNNASGSNVAGTVSYNAAHKYRDVHSGRRTVDLDFVYGQRFNLGEGRSGQLTRDHVYIELLDAAPSRHHASNGHRQFAR